VFQFSDPAFFRPHLAIAGKVLDPALVQFAFSAMQHVRVYFTGPRHLGSRGSQFQSPHGGFFEFSCELPSRHPHLRTIDSAPSLDVDEETAAEVRLALSGRGETIGNEELKQKLGLA